MPSDLRFDFPASARLKRRADFQKIYRHGFRVSGKHVVLFVMLGEGRFGVTASRKVGIAVRRSRTKRRLRELYRLSRKRLRVGSWDIVANARKSVASAPWTELEGDFLASLQKATEQAERRTSGRNRADRN